MMISAKQMKSNTCKNMCVMYVFISWRRQPQVLRQSPLGAGHKLHPPAPSSSHMPPIGSCLLAARRAKPERE